MKVLIVLMFILFGAISFADNKAFEIPVDVEEIVTIYNYRSTGGYSVRKYNTGYQEKAEFKSLGQAIKHFQNKGFVVLKIFKDAIDPEYFICLKRRYRK